MLEETLKRALRVVFGAGLDINAANPLQVYDPKVFNSLVVYEGTATADGPDTSTITDTVLADKPDFNGQLVVITSDDYKGQTRDIDQATDAGGGKVHVAAAFDGTIAEGTTYVILSIRPTTAEVAAIEAKLDKLAGEAPAEDSVEKNWNAATDSPDDTGGLLVNLGTAATRKKLHSLLLDVSALTDGAVIHVKLFIKINDTQRKVYDETFTVNTDPDGLWIVNGTVGLHDVLSVAVYSDNDETKAIGYTAMLEAQ